MSEKIKFVVSWIVCLIGFVLWCMFLYKNQNISTDAYLNTVWAGLGVLLFTLSPTIIN